jgi:glycosyltransferase involved in cell wall biosynthesis
MRASIEYLVAGLPIVSTRSVGGREYFFDDDYCVVVGDDPREIRDAVAAIIARNIPRDYIRNKTMARVTRKRDRFMKWVQDLIDRNAGNDRFAQSFEHMLPNGGLRPWVSVSDFARNTIDALNRAEPQSGGP